MTDTPIERLPPTERRRLIAWGLVRALTSTTVLFALYFLAPIGHIVGVAVGASLAVALLALLGVSVWQIRAIVLAAHPGVRAIEALAATVPLFILLFAASYFVLAQDDPANFSTHALTRIDALYFAVTVFATVGVGDITATSQNARLLVSAQMILDLLVLGLGIRVFLGAAQRGFQRQATDPGATAADGSSPPTERDHSCCEDSPPSRTSLPTTQRRSAGTRSSLVSRPTSTGPGTPSSGSATTSTNSA